MTIWRSTANDPPKYSGSYLVYSSKSGKVFQAHYYADHNHWSGSSKYITHWMKLPHPSEEYEIVQFGQFRFTGSKEHGESLKVERLDGGDNHE